MPRKRRSARTLTLLALALALLGAGVGWFAWWSSRLEHSQDAPIRTAAARYGVDPALVKAVVWKESRFDPDARGRAGEIGLMQITDAAAQEWAEAESVYPLPESHLYDPRTNTLAGTWYLGKLLRRYQGADRPAAFALADYNAGRANVLKWIKNTSATNSTLFVAGIGFPSTRNYVVSVLSRRNHYAPRSSTAGR